MIHSKNKSGFKQPIKVSLSMLSVGLILGACTLAPKYQSPQIQSNIPLPAPTLSAEITLRAHQIGWRNYFADPQLKALIEIGLKNNYDVQKAILNLKKAKAQYGLDIYSLIPNVQMQDISKIRTGPLDSSSKTIIQQSYSTGLGVTRFELDVYRKFDQQQASEHQLKATYYDKLNSDIAIISAIAKKYLSMRIDENILHNAQQSLDYQKELYKIQQLRHSAGIISTLELLNHQNAFDSTQSNFLDVKEKYNNSINELAILIGQPIPANLPPRNSLDSQFRYTSFPKDIPSEVMLYRPDIRSAEERLKQSNAQIGVARAALFPRITLNGSINSGSTHFDNLFNLGSMSWSAGPSVTIPLFDIYPNLTKIKISKLIMEEMVLNYNHIIQQAFFEVVTALNVADKLTSQYQLSAKIMENNKKTRDLTRLRFDQGIADRNEMLDAEKRYINSQDSFLNVQRTKLFNQVDLYTSLGGGVHKNNTIPKINIHNEERPTPKVK